MFSSRESYFSNIIFNSYIDNRQRVFNYDKNLTYFITSLSWRSLYLDLQDFITMPNFNKDHLLTLFHEEQIMRDYLLGKRQNLEAIENHIFFLEKVDSVHGMNNLSQPNATMHRTICSYSGYNGDTIFTLSNLMGILIVTLYSKGIEEQWIETKIENGNGTIKVENQQIRSVIAHEIERWAMQADEAHQHLSKEQQQKIQSRLDTIGEDVKNYPIYKNWVDDTSLK